jgi:4-hydroxy-tetrahydrodipicolinate synthase
MQFTGNMVALVTPFRNGVLDRTALARLVERTIDGGVSALVPCGTTGESPTLSHAEHDEVVAAVVELAAGRVPVVAGAGSNSTAEAVRLTRAAASAGAAAVLSVTPYYNRPNQDGLRRHFLAVADASELPVVLYDIPGRSVVRLALATTVALSEHPNIRAVKEATGDVENVTRIRAETSLAVLSGDDALTLPILALGGKGVISVLSNLLPAPMSRLVALGLAGQLVEALGIHDRLYPLMKSMFLDTNPTPVKHALAAIGLCSAELRLPLCELGAADAARLEQALEPFLDELAG